MGTGNSLYGKEMESRQIRISGCKFGQSQIWQKWLDQKSSTSLLHMTVLWDVWLILAMERFTAAELTCGPARTSDLKQFNNYSSY